MELYRCPVCGFPGLEENPDNPNQLEFYGSCEICSCCGIEFGYDVFVGIPGGIEKATIKLREAWVKKGAPWFSSYTQPPSDWDWRENLRAIGVDPDTCELIDEGKQ